MRFPGHLILVATAGIIAASPCVAEEKISNALFEKALGHYRNGEYRQALEIVNVIESEEPDRVLFGKENIHNFKGSCLTALRYFQHARKEFEKALEAQPESFDMQYNMAELNFLQEHFAAAREAFAGLKGTDEGRPFSEFLDFKIGMCLLMEGDKEGVAEEIGDRSSEAPLALFLNAAVALHAKNAGKAEVILLLAREKLDAGNFALYEDSLIECGLITPPRLSRARQEELDAALRRPLSLGTDRLLPERSTESADDPTEPGEPAAAPTETADDPIDPAAPPAESPAPVSAEMPAARTEES